MGFGAPPLTLIAAITEEVTTLPPPSVAYLDKFIRLKGGGRGRSKVYTCVQNSNGSYEWNQLTIST